MNNYLNKVAVKGNKNRKEAILEILDSIGAKHKIVGRATENIVVSFNPSSSRLVIGAHYDAASEDIEAANDNAAACVILLNLIADLKDTSKSIDFVFFDREETREHFGSNEYIEIIGKENIEACINLDMCGLGHNVVLAYKDFGKPVFKKDPYKSFIEDCPNVMKELPSGDADNFFKAGIPCIYIVNSTDRDLEWYRIYESNIWRAVAIYQKYDFAQTMHLPSDTVSSLDPSGMELIYDYLAKRL